jgi:glycosyltransferase involved in cell wall biosynthesis
MGPPDPEVAHLSPDATGQGGIAAVLRGIAESPLAERYRMRFITTYRHGDGRVQRLTRFAGALASLARWCLRRGPRLVHLHSGTRGSWYRKCTALAVAQGLRRPVIIQVHSGPGDVEETWADFGPARRRWLRRAFHRADRVLAVSRASADALEDALGLPEVLVVPNAAPLPPPRGGSSVPAGEAVACVLYLGGFENPGKGYETLLAAVPELLEGDAGLSVALAGPGEPTPQAWSLIGDRVRWLGWLGEREKTELLDDPNTIFVLSSDSEGLPMALLEAMAHGTAIVATAVGGIPDTLTDDVDSRVVPPGAPAALARATLELARAPAERRRLGAAARARVERLDRAEVYDRLALLYDELAGPAVGDGE